MTRVLAVTEVKAKLLALLDDVEAGEDIEITRHGVTVARLTSARGPHALKDRFAGIVVSSAVDYDLFSTGVRWNVE